MKCTVLIRAVVVLSFPFVLGQKTFLDSDKNIRIYRAVKELAVAVVGRTGDDSQYHQEGRYQQRVQRRIPDEVPFPCNLTEHRSKNVPKSVHELRPGDIDIIGALGDSLTAGTGIFALNIFDLLIENRGVAALGGGQASWREFLTVPNILKEFNANLMGYSLYDSATHQKASEFNVAEIGAMSRDLPFMAENLIRRMNNNPKVDLQNHWKLISILMGPNDFCSDMCYSPSGPWSIVENHKYDLITTLRILKQYLPRTVVSLIPPPNLTILTKLRGKSTQCMFLAQIECSCLLGLRWKADRDEFSDVMDAWQKIDAEVASYPEFQADDFTVVVQPFATNLTFPFKPDGSPEWRYLSQDCFHLSQIANAQVSLAVWKNLLEPVGRKSVDWDDSTMPVCPTKSRPYIATSANSRQESRS